MQKIFIGPSPRHAAVVLNDLNVIDDLLCVHNGHNKNSMQGYSVLRPVLAIKIKSDKGAIMQALQLFKQSWNDISSSINVTTITIQEILSHASYKFQQLRLNTLKWNIHGTNGKLLRSYNTKTIHSNIPNLSIDDFAIPTFTLRGCTPSCTDKIFLQFFMPVLVAN